MAKVLLFAVCLIVHLQFVKPKADIARLQRIKPWDITVTENGYNIIIGISDEVDQFRSRQLIDNLKTLFTAASEQLYQVTG